MNDEETRINFLTTAIADAQELIRFIDTKTAIVITILGSYVVGLFTTVERLVLYFPQYSWGLKIVMTLFLSFLVICIIVTYRIIESTDSPIDNIKIDNADKPTLGFYIASNEYNINYSQFFINSKNFKLKDIYATYLTTLTTATSGEIIKALTVELFKVSFIRNIKNDRFSFLLKMLIATTFAFIVFYIMLSQETSVIKALAEIKK